MNGCVSILSCYEGRNPKLRQHLETAKDKKRSETQDLSHEHITEK
jgi:hypothetical protein